MFTQPTTSLEPCYQNQMLLLPPEAVMRCGRDDNKSMWTYFVGLTLLSFCTSCNV